MRGNWTWPSPWKLLPVNLKIDTFIILLYRCFVLNLQLNILPWLEKMLLENAFIIYETKPPPVFFSPTSYLVSIISLDPQCTCRTSPWTFSPKKFVLLWKIFFAKNPASYLRGRQFISWWLFMVFSL